MRSITSFMLTLALAAFAVAEDKKYALTGDNTKIEWTGTKKDGKHTGGFKTVSGTASVTEKGIALDVEIDCDSLYSDDAKLTGHLKGPDFFDVKVKENAKAKFVTKKVEKSDKGYTVTGDLTLHNKTKEISFPAEISTDGGLSLKAEFKIDRNDYGISFGKGQIHDDVALKVTVTAK